MKYRLDKIERVDDETVRLTLTIQHRDLSASTVFYARIDHALAMGQLYELDMIAVSK